MNCPFDGGDRAAVCCQARLLRVRCDAVFSAIGGTSDGLSCQQRHQASCASPEVSAFSAQGELL